MLRQVIIPTRLGNALSERGNALCAMEARCFAPVITMTMTVGLGRGDKHQIQQAAGSSYAVYRAGLRYELVEKELQDLRPAERTAKGLIRGPGRGVCR